MQYKISENSQPYTRFNRAICKARGASNKFKVYVYYIGFQKQLGVWYALPVKVMNIISTHRQLSITKHAEGG